MKVLVLSTVFPSPAQPMHGLFVFERTRHMRRHADLVVVAPISWRVRLRTRVPRRHVLDGLTVLHPTYFYVPGIFKIFDGVFLFLSTLLTIRRIRREFAFDLIDAHFAYPEGFAAMLLGRWFRRPVTLTLRGTILQMMAYPLRRRAIAWSLSQAARVITVSHELADLAISLGVDPSKLEVIPNGVDGERFTVMDRGKARRALGLDPNRRWIVSVGHLSPRKGFDRVLRALPGVMERIPDVSFAIVGGAGVERDNKAEIERLASSPSLRGRVVLAGAQPSAAVATWLNAADVFVLASDQEGCPNVVWEALACGRPVVVTRVGETPRMVPAFAGILFDNPNDIEALRDALARALTTEWDEPAIRAHATAHTWDGVAQRVFGQWSAACEWPAEPAWAHDGRLSNTQRKALN